MKKKRYFIFLLILSSQAKSQQPPIDSSLEKLTSHIFLSTPLDARKMEGDLRNILFDSLIHSANSILPDFPNFNKTPFSFSGGDISYYNLYDNGFSRSLLNHLEFNSYWSLAGVPFNINYDGAKWSTDKKNYYSVKFDKDKYADILKKKLLDKLDPKAILASLPDPVAAIKLKARQMLQAELIQVNARYDNMLSGKLKQLGDLESIFKMDIQTIRESFLQQDYLKGLSEKENLYEQLQSRINLGEKVDTNLFMGLKKSILELKGIKDAIAIIEKHKTGWSASGLLKKINDAELLRNEKLNQFLNNPSTIAKMAAKQLNLNSLQRFFLKINRFNLGQNSLSSSPLSINHFLNNGAVTQFLNNGKSVLFFIGRSSENASILDQQFSNTAFTNTLAKAIQFGKQHVGGGTGVSVMSFDQGFNTMGDLSGLNNFRRSLVTTLNKDFVVGAHGMVSTEISRSISSYNLNSGHGDANSLTQILSPENFMGNTSFALNYRDELPNFGLTYQAHIKKSALGYDNPGNPFLNTGSKELGFSFRKSLYKKKLLISVRSTIREFEYGEKESKWLNIYSVLDVKWKLRRGQFISLRYLPSRMQRINISGRHNSTVFDQLAFDGNLSKSFSSKQYNNYFSLSYQRNQFDLGNRLIGNTSLGLISNQTLVIQGFMFYLNTQLNKAISKSDLVYFNSNFNTEAGASFNARKNINFTTSICYNEVQAWYKQIGVRESISLNMNEKLDLHLFIDARKNLRLYEPIFFGLIRAEAGLNYYFK